MKISPTSSPHPRHPHPCPPLPLKRPPHLPLINLLSLPIWLTWVCFQTPLKICGWRSLPLIFTTISCRWRCSGSGLIMVSRCETVYWQNLPWFELRIHIFIYFFLYCSKAETQRSLHSQVASTYLHYKCHKHRQNNNGGGIHCFCIKWCIDFCYFCFTNPASIICFDFLLLGKAMWF